MVNILTSERTLCQKFSIEWYIKHLWKIYLSLGTYLVAPDSRSNTFMAGCKRTAFVRIFIDSVTIVFFVRTAIVNQSAIWKTKSTVTKFHLNPSLLFSIWQFSLKISTDHRIVPNYVSGAFIGLTWFFISLVSVFETVTMLRSDQVATISCSAHWNTDLLRILHQMLIKRACFSNIWILLAYLW